MFLAGLAGLLVLGLGGLLYLCSVIWVYRDARRRGWGDTPAVGVAALVALCFWPLGLAAWLMMRPPLPYVPLRPSGWYDDPSHSRSAYDP